jgi:hypothetical protein
VERSPTGNQDLILGYYGIIDEEEEEEEEEEGDDYHVDEE